MKTQVKEHKVRLISSTDQAYPTNLRYIYDPPPQLYVKGNIIPEDNIAIAIVGSRRATYYGLKNAQGLGFELAARGITVISGLARGVDAAAHRGALKAKGRTIAVLGSGLNMIYPPENIELAEQIMANGAVISEFTHDTPPLRQNFPRRNRIISGLSLGVVVVEAAKRSGALITANFALEQGREVFALPGKVDSYTSQGTHELIKQGAKLTESTQDIIEEIEPLMTAYIGEIKKENQTRTEPNLTKQQKQIYTHLSSNPVHIDQLIGKSNSSYGALLAALLKMEHQKLVKELPGKMYVRI